MFEFLLIAGLIGILIWGFRPAFWGEDTFKKTGGEDPNRH